MQDMAAGFRDFINLCPKYVGVIFPGVAFESYAEFLQNDSREFVTSCILIADSTIKTAACSSCVIPHCGF